MSPRTTNTKDAGNRSAKTARPASNKPDCDGLPGTANTGAIRPTTDPAMLANQTPICVAHSDIRHAMVCGVAPLPASSGQAQRHIFLPCQHVGGSSEADGWTPRSLRGASRLVAQPPPHPGGLVGNFNEQVWGTSHERHHRQATTSLSRSDHIIDHLPALGARITRATRLTDRPNERCCVTISTSCSAASTPTLPCPSRHRSA